MPIHDPELGPLAGVEVPMPIQTTVAFTAEGDVAREDAAEAPAEALHEASHYIQSLLRGRKIALDAASPEPGVTHVVEHGPGGRRQLRRVRME